MSDNLSVWTQVQAVDQKHIKQANVSGHKCLSVNGLEMVRLITEALGPIGQRWKYSVKWERFDDECPIVNPSTNEPYMCDGKTLWQQSHTALIELSVKHDDEWHSYEQMGHTPYRYGSGGTVYNGQTKPFKIVVDKEYGKKTITDGLKKCLSMLGVAADVYTGALDDHNYAQQAQDEIEVKKADKEADAQAEMVEEIKKQSEGAVKFIKEASDYDQAKRTVKRTQVWLGTRAASSNPKTSRPASHGLSLIEQALIEKQKEGEK